MTEIIELVERMARAAFESNGTLPGATLDGYRAAPGYREVARWLIDNPEAPRDAAIDKAIEIVGRYMSKQVGQPTVKRWGPRIDIMRKILSEESRIPAEPMEYGAEVQVRYGSSMVTWRRNGVNPQRPWVSRHLAARWDTVIHGADGIKVVMSPGTTWRGGPTKPMEYGSKGQMEYPSPALAMQTIGRTLRSEVVNPTPKRRLQLVVDHRGHVTRYYPIDRRQGWRVDTDRRLIVIGRGVPRTEIPLDSVLSYAVEEIGEST